MTSSRNCVACGRRAVTGRIYCAEHVTDEIESLERDLLGRDAPRTPDQVAQLRCPHCDARGQVSQRTVARDRGISGAKATGAVLTAGLSVLATGLSQQVEVTECRCANCGTVWTVS